MKVNFVKDSKTIEGLNREAYSDSPLGKSVFDRTKRSHAPALGNTRGTPHYKRGPPHYTRGMSRYISYA